VLTIICLSLISISYPDNRGWTCCKGLEGHHIQTGPCNSIEKNLLLFIYVLESKQWRMPTWCLWWVPWEMFKSTEGIMGLCSQWRCDLIKSCHHELHNLQMCADMWWYTRDHLGGPQWFDCPKGCAFCESMFNVGDKWMRMFCVKKICAFVLPVSWTSQLRLRQNKRDLARFFSPRTDGGVWSVVMCSLCGWMLLWIDSDRQILGGILADCRRIVCSALIGMQSCSVWCVALWIVHQIFQRLLWHALPNSKMTVCQEANNTSWLSVLELHQ
jgi:hypothetical protein